MGEGSSVGATVGEGDRVGVVVGGGEVGDGVTVGDAVAGGRVGGKLTGSAVAAPDPVPLHRGAVMSIDATTSVLAISHSHFGLIVFSFVWLRFCFR